ncbi:MAG: hypothetical protein ACQXXH_08200 [Candidatus Bathyarchaeia archaeon]|nr:hypothetical protein [Candidatus Bathyarchaeota archaeon A05DMB-4]MDH7596021.1 hypothetical protein [Candidatus Bathyarchaeota archaeon]
MNKKPSKDEALEALDFIISVLKEHEKDLDRLINELGIITEKIGEKGEHTEKIERVEQRLSLIQNELTQLIKFLSIPPQTKEQIPTITPKTEPPPTTPTTETPTPYAYPRGPPVIVRCKQWEDFKTLAAEADTISFLYKDTEKTFQADALKNGRVLTYNGQLPADAKLLKAWLARELNTHENRIFEGVLAIG